MARIDETDAPTLIAAGIAAERIEADLVPAPATPAATEIPAHHIQCAYEALCRGSGVDSAAKLAGVPREVAAQVATEIVACCDKLGTAAPAPCKAEAERAKIVEEPVEPGGEVVIK